MISLFLIGARNLKRSWFRTSFTIAGAAIALLFFLTIRILLGAYSGRAEAHPTHDRLATRHRVSLLMLLPKKYVAEVRTVPGVVEATWTTWFGGIYAPNRDLPFPNLAVDADSYLRVNKEITISDEDKARWRSDKTGAVIGAALAKRMGWKIGDKVILEGSFYPGDFEFHIDGIYTVAGGSFAGGWDDTTFLFHYNYLNDSALVKDQVGWISASINDDKRSTEIAKAIDAKFDAYDNQTLTVSENTLLAGLNAGLETILAAFNGVSIIVVLIMLLILGNTIAMGVRERTREFAVLRAIGFEPGHVRFFIIAEAAVLGLIAGGVGLALAYPFINGVLAPVAAESLGGSYPPAHLHASTAALACAGTVTLAIVASFIPAFGASRASVTESLRRVG